MNHLITSCQPSYTGKYDQAKKLLQDTVQIIVTSVSAGEEYCQGLISDLTRAQDSMKSQAQYRQHGAKFMMSKYALSFCNLTMNYVYIYRMQSHSAQRSNMSDDLPFSNPYLNLARDGLVAKSKAMKSKK